ncbi:Pseudopilin GspJ [Symmachiella macrocystis]|uniref:Type II secretion system protein J n=1 Tax=Symmachiella macrocystis TaxID=2527985 RepID=A0A5C6BAJ9_9PLAN|nr:type II secretion system protein GspJ [Symmachiella macrocystis]TWU09113.1 Pseudopilin GspJ [Symmachiella macrocystis]
MRRIPPPLSRHPCLTTRSGFTLMEVLLVTILSAVLMVGLWNLFGTYIRLFESGPARTERAQLLRALKQQISDDLRGAIQIAEIPDTSSSVMTFGTEATSSELTPGGETSQNSAAIASSSESSPLPRFGIVGTSQSLAIVTLQVPAVSPNAPSASDLPVDFAEQMTSLAPELRTVLYTFNETREQSPLDHGPPPGLLRRDLDWQTALSDREFAAASEFGIADSPDVGSSEEIVIDDSMMWVPEISELKIRYFGNGRWQSSWDSLQNKTLPSAVEIILELHDPDDLNADEDDETAMDSSSEPEELVLDNDVGSNFIDPEVNQKQQRILIYLPGGLKTSHSSSGGLGFPASDSQELPGGAP